MKQAMLLITALLMSSSLTAQTYVTLLGDYARASSDEFDNADLDGWGVGIDLTHWFDNEVYVNVAGGISKSSISECIQGACVRADADVKGTSLAVGMRFNGVTPFVRTRFEKVESTFSITDVSITDDETEWDYGVGALVEFGDMIYGVSADGLRDTDEGFLLFGEVTFKVTNADGITVKIGRLFNVDEIESTSFGVGWVRFF